MAGGGTLWSAHHICILFGSFKLFRECTQKPKAGKKCQRKGWERVPVLTAPPLTLSLSLSTVTIKLQLKLLPALVCARKYATRFLFKYHSIFKSNPDASVFCALALFLFAVFCFLCVPPFFFCVACTLHSPLWCSAFNFHLVYFNVIFNSSVFSRALLARSRFVLQASVAGPPPRSIVMLVLVPATRPARHCRVCLVSVVALLLALLVKWHSSALLSPTEFLLSLK